MALKQLHYFPHSTGFSIEPLRLHAGNNSVCLSVRLSVTL